MMHCKRHCPERYGRACEFREEMLPYIIEAIENNTYACHLQLSELVNENDEPVIDFVEW